MLSFKWDATKSLRLKKTRGASFEEVTKADLVDIQAHPSRSEQVYLMFWFRQYIWVVPAVEESHYLFLKTLFPSRKYTKIYKERFDEKG